MAITAIEYALFRQMREQGALPLDGDILELGEANWYGDVPIDQLKQDIDRFAPERERLELAGRAEEAMRARRKHYLFEVAKVWWRCFWRPASLTAIDLNGTPQALRQDLNHPLALPRRYHAVLNLGTAEHVFNVAQVMKSIHDHTLPGGLMVHGLPFAGWVDHGFYSFNPTFYWDLAAANGYAMLACVYAELNPLKLIQLARREAILDMAKGGQIGRNALIYAFLRKPEADAEFRIPEQGYYAKAVSAEAAKAWNDLR